MNTNVKQPTNMCEIHGVEMRPLIYETEFFKALGILVCDLCQNEREAENKARADAEEAQKKKEQLFRGIPPLFQSARLEHFANIDPILDWVNKPTGFLFVHGVCGCGKSHLSSAIKYKYNSEKKDCCLTFSSDLFLSIRNCFNNNSGETEKSLIDGYSSRLRIFDDVGAQKISDYVIEAWYNIIDKRYMNEIPTMFTSNLSLREISLCMTDRIASRIASGKVFELKGMDRRVTRNR